MERIIGLILFIITLPLYPIVFILIKSTSSGEFIFRQKRVGKNKKTFTIYKFRTMVHNAERLKSKYIKLNEAHGPVFKIRNDPRHTTVGRILSKSAIDELPQLINIIRGEMSFVGPRPLPLSEAKKVPEKYSARFSVLPGLTSPWIIKGSHQLSFKKWMNLDCEYAKSKNRFDDMLIISKTIFMLTKYFLHLFYR